MTKKKDNQQTHSINGKRRFDMYLDEDYYIEDDMLNTSVSENENIDIDRKCQMEEVGPGEVLNGERPDDEDNVSQKNDDDEEEDQEENDETDNYDEYWGTRKMRIVEEDFSRLSLHTADGNCDISDEFEQLAHHFTKTILITSTKTKFSKNKRKPQQTKVSTSSTTPHQKTYNSSKNNSILQGSVARSVTSQQNNMLLELLLNSHRFSHQQHFFASYPGTVAIYQGSPLNVLLQNLKNFVNRQLSPSIFKKYQKNYENSSPNAVSLVSVNAIGQKIQDHQDQDRESIDDKDQEI